MAVNTYKNHAVLKVACSNPEIKETFSGMVKLYTNSRYHRMDTKMGIAYFFFENEDKGYYYLTSDN